MFYGAGTDISFDQRTKIAGLIIAQTSDLDDPSSLYITKFDDIHSGRSMVSTYGSDLESFSERGFMWAGELDMKIVAPNATKTGSYFTGSIALG